MSPEFLENREKQNSRQQGSNTIFLHQSRPFRAVRLGMSWYFELIQAKVVGAILGIEGLMPPK